MNVHICLVMLHHPLRLVDVILHNLKAYVCHLFVVSNSRFDRIKCVILIESAKTTCSETERNTTGKKQVRKVVSAPVLTFVFNEVV